MGVCFFQENGQLLMFRYVFKAKIDVCDLTAFLEIVGLAEQFNWL